MKRLTKQQELAIKKAVSLASQVGLNRDRIASQMEIDAYEDFYAD